MHIHFPEFENISCERLLGFQHRASWHVVSESIVFSHFIPDIVNYVGFRI